MKVIIMGIIMSLGITCLAAGGIGIPVVGETNQIINVVIDGEKGLEMFNKLYSLPASSCFDSLKGQVTMFEKEDVYCWKAELVDAPAEAKCFLSFQGGKAIAPIEIEEPPCPR